MHPEAMAIRITAILFPIFAIVAAGYVYGRRHAPEMGVANRLNMDVFVLALVIAGGALFGWLLAAGARERAGRRGRPWCRR